MKSNSFIRLNLFAVLFLFGIPVIAQQSLHYDFRNSLSERNSMAPALNALGAGSYISESLQDLSCLSRTVYSFTQNSGVQFDNGAAGNFLGTSYSIEMYFRFTDNTGFFRIMDFKNRTADFGLYATNAILQFYDEITINTTVFATNEYEHLVLTRDGNTETVNIYLNGALEGSFVDNSGSALPDGSDVINFFQDDLVFPGEAQPGNIALLKFYNYELDATTIAGKYSGLESTMAAVAFSSDVTIAPLATNVFNFTNESQNSGSVTYTWQFGDGNSTTGTNASHTYSTSGNFNVLLIADNGGGCSDTASLMVTVTGGVPTITPSGPVDLCVGGSVTLTSSPGVSYLWSTGATSQSILVTTAGDYSVTVDDGLGNIQTSDVVTVTKFASAPGGINNFVGPVVACPGLTLTYSFNPVNRVVYYTWTLPAGAAINGQNPYIGTSNSEDVTYAGGFAGGTIQVTAHNGCGVRGPATKTVSVAPPLTPSAINGSATACPNTTQTYSTPLVPGVDTYNWTAPPGATITSGQGTNQVDILFPGGFAAGYIYLTNQNVCGTSNQRSLYVRSTPPKPSSVTGPTTSVCGTTQTYTVQSTLGATFYTWTPPTGSSIVSGQGTQTVQIMFAGSLNTGYVKVSAGNACGSSANFLYAVSGAVVITSEPQNVSSCANLPVSFSVVAPGTGVSYQWKRNGVNLSNGGSISGATSATLNINPVMTSDAGNYTCVVQNTCNTSDTSNIAVLSVSEIPAPPGTINGAGEACDSDMGVAYSFTPVPGATSYNWLGDTGVTIASGQGSNAITVNFGPTPLSGYTLFVVALNSCGQSDTSTLWVRTKVSTPNFTVAPVTVCPGTNGVIYAAGSVVGASGYTWTVPANATIASGQGTQSVTIDFGAGFTSGQVCVTASNTCFTTPPRCKTVSSVPSTPGNIQGVTINVCNSSQPYTVNPISTATGYIWTAPTGATISSGQGTNSVVVDFGPSFVSGDLQVVAQNACGGSGTRTRLIQAFPAKPDEVFGNAAPCLGSPGNVYSIAPLAGATSYTWTVPSGAVITNGANTESITVTFGSVDGLITAHGNNACGSGFSRGLRVTFGCRLEAVEGDRESDIYLYPNPVTDQLNLVFDHVAFDKATLSVYDLAGRIILQRDIEIAQGLAESKLNIQDLKAGLYFISINSGNDVILKKFIKE